MVIDFDGGGRFQCEMTDVDPGKVAIGERVEMTFRRLYTAEGVHNYFWKARPIRVERRETDMASARDPRPGRHRRHGLHEVRRALGQERRRPPDRLVGGGAQVGRRRRIDDIDAFWLGTMGSGLSGLTLSRPLKIDYKPVTRLENMCATGSEAFRNALLRRCLRRVRHGDGHRRREAEGLRLLRSHRQSSAQRRHAADA